MVSMSSRQTRNMDQVYEVIKRPDGLFDIFHNGELTDKSVSDGWLEDQLVKYGICGEEYRETRRKLDSIGQARLVFQTGRIKTKLRTSDDSIVRLEGIQ
jgi:hypothetical protein